MFPSGDKEQQLKQGPHLAIYLVLFYFIQENSNSEIKQTFKNENIPIALIKC